MVQEQQTGSSKPNAINTSSAVTATSNNGSNGGNSNNTGSYQNSSASWRWLLFYDKIALRFVNDVFLSFFINKSFYKHATFFLLF